MTDHATSLIRAIKKGEIHRNADARRVLGVSERTVMRVVLALRDSGYHIDTDPARGPTERRPWRIKRNGRKA